MAVVAHFANLVDYREVRGTRFSVDASLVEIHRFSEVAAEPRCSSHAAAYEKAVVEGHGAQVGGRDARIVVVVLGRQYVWAMVASH